MTTVQAPDILRCAYMEIVVTDLEASRKFYVDTLGLVVATGTQEAAAANRDWLRADATGSCEWDRVGWWVQRCDVWSQAMGRNIPVQIQPAKNGGNAGLYLLDGLRATDSTNAWVNDVNAARTYEPHNITLVMPVGGAGSFYAEWNVPATYDLVAPTNYQWETLTLIKPPSTKRRMTAAETAHCLRSESFCSVDSPASAI